MIKRFISYYKPHMKLFTLDMFCALIVAAAGLFYPTIARDIINDYAHRDELSPLFFWSAVLLLIYAIKAVCNYVVGYLGHVVGVRMQRDMRRDLFLKYEALPISYYDENKTGDLLSRLVNDLFDVSELAHHGPENVFLSVLMLIGSFVILSGIYLPLALIMFSIIPIIVTVTGLSRARMRRAMKASKKQIGVLNSNLENAITGIRETKSYRAEKIEIAKFNRDNGQFAAYRSEAMKSMGSYHSMMEFLTDLLYLVVIFAGGIFLFKGKINAGEFTAFILYIGMFMDPIRRFATLFEQLQEGMSGFARFAEIMELAEEVDEGKITPENFRGEIAFKDVSFHYDGGSGRDVLSHLSLSIPEGQTLALVGPSGGGKSTLCHLIPRFYEITDGEILLDGVDIRDIPLTWLRKNIGMVSQSVFLFDGTIRDNICYGTPDATDEQIIEAAKKANIYEDILALPDGLDTHVGERGVKLSGGQKQRVAIARVFLKNPKLLILDEATSALDNATEMQVQAALEKLSVGRTVLVVAHRLSTVKEAERIVVLDKTGIIESGTHEELIAAGGKYKALYEYQFRA
ncbi:MAG: ABC transporter ATP-binding protein [Clostridia bacterium]|nr:ABC transporter ATP-binding protein [Clostridia bacterium]